MATTDNAFDAEQRRHGFIIAAILIVGFLSITAIPLMTGDVTGAKDLAGIFSGWIAAIVGFYFIQGQAAQAAAAANEGGRQVGAAAVEGIDSAYEELRAKHVKTKNELQETYRTLLELTEEQGGS